MSKRLKEISVLLLGGVIVFSSVGLKASVMVKHTRPTTPIVNNTMSISGTTMMGTYLLHKIKMGKLQAISSNSDETTQTKTKKKLLGEFDLTFYCPCSKCNGEWTGQPTASGAEMTTGTTIAVDPRVIPLGTKVYIEGIGERVAQDTGSAIKGNKVDVLMDTHSECLELGRQYDKKIWIIE